MQAVKIIFEAFIDRTIDFDYAHHLGLITFATRAKLVEEIGPVIHRLRKVVRQLTLSRNTALWDALVLANSELTAYGQKYPKAKKRIIVLSDGENNQQNHTALEACQTLQVTSLINYGIDFSHPVSLSTVLLLVAPEIKTSRRYLMRNA
jgi:Mg-chelatase subunit ChlD